MPEKDPSNWTRAAWLLTFSAGCAGYIVRLTDRVKQRRVRSALIEILDGVVCLLIAFGARMVTLSFGMDENLAWAICALSAHKGTRLIFVLEDLALRNLPIKGDEKQ